MTAAVIWARLTSATSTLETGEAFAFASGSVANTLVGAFAVEMGFVPFCGVDVTSQTVVGVVLFSDGGVVVVEVDLLISVNALVSVNVTKRRVDEGVATVAKTFSTVIANETAFTFTGGTGVAHTVVVAVVVAASCNLCHQGTQCCEANGVHFVVFVFCWCCCTPCAIAQEAHEIEKVKHNKTSTSSIHNNVKKQEQPKHKNGLASFEKDLGVNSSVTNHTETPSKDVSTSKKVHKGKKTSQSKESTL